MKASTKKRALDADPDGKCSEDTTLQHSTQTEDSKNPRPAAAPAPKKAKKAKFADALYGAYGEPRTAIPWPPVQRVPIADSNFRAIAWNVAGLRGFLGNKERVEHLEKCLEEEKPSIIALSETKLQEVHEADVCAELKKLAPDYEVTFNSCTNADKKGYSGVAVMVNSKSEFQPKKISSLSDSFFSNGESLLAKSKLPEEAATVKTVPTTEDEGRILLVEYEEFVVISVYTPNSGAALDRLNYRTELWDACYRELVESQTKPVIAIGDFNAAHLDADIWNLNISKTVPESAGTTPQERASFDRLLKECGLVDTLRKQIGGPDVLGHFSYWSQRAKNKPMNRGLRLDYCLVSEALEGYSKDGFLLRDFTPQFGDHCPVGVSLQLPYSS